MEEDFILNDVTSLEQLEQWLKEWEVSTCDNSRFWIAFKSLLETVYSVGYCDGYTGDAEQLFNQD